MLILLAVHGEYYVSQEIVVKSIKEKFSLRRVEIAVVWVEMCCIVFCMDPCRLNSINDSLIRVITAVMGKIKS